MTKDLRDTNAQQKYRKSSSSQYPDKKHVAHVYPLEIAQHVQSHTRGPRAQELRSSVNTSGNFRMVNTSTNQVTHRNIDQNLIQKAQSGVVLTKEQQARAMQQVKFLQSNQDNIPPGHYNEAKKLYKSMKTSDNRTVWDARRDKK